MDGEAKSRGLPRWFQILAIGRKPKWTLVRIGVIIVAAFLLVHFVVLPIRIQGISMMPTYHDGDVNFLNRLAYSSHEPQRGDVVGIRFSETGQKTLLLKRIIALPGERIAFHAGRLYINGEEMSEPYLKWPYGWNMQERELGLDEYYVVGDNRTMPIENHTQGAAQRSLIVGKIIFGGKS